MTAPSAKSVPPSAIQDTLNKIWESLETKNVTRACLFNLIFYTQKNNRIPYVQKLAQRVIERFPARVIFVSAERNALEPKLDTQVSILTSKQGEFDIACDYIQVDASGSSFYRIPYVVLPHILPDLPVYLILAEDPCQDDPLLLELEQLAHRLIFDSETTENLSQFAANILYQHKRLGLEIADLNWARLETYRQLFSSTFHDPSCLEALKHSRTIQITYNSQKTPFFCHNKIQSVYFQAWLASQLGWEFCQLETLESQTTFTYRGPSSPVDITLTPFDCSTLPPGLILAIDITTAQEEHFSFNQDMEQLHQITYHHSTKERCDLPLHTRFPKEERGHSLVKEICHRGTSSHFLNTLHFLEKIEMAGLC